MMSATLNGYLVILQDPATTRAPAAAAPRAAATARQQAEADRALADQIRAQVREQIGQDVYVGPTPPTPPTRRSFTIQAPNGQRTVITTPPPGEIIPPEAVDISIAFFIMVAVIIIGLPLARAFARRMDRKGAGTAQMPGEVSAQLAHLNQAVDAIALEVERITEGQRFTTRLLTEQRESARQTLPSGVDR